MSRLPRPTWPEEEWKQWMAPGLYDSASDLNAIQGFEMKIRDVLRNEVHNFVNIQCQERGVGSPDLRRLAPVALWQAIERVADNLLIEAAAACREEGLPWAAMSMITDYAGPTGFQRRYGTSVNAAIEERARAREDGYIPYGDPDNK